MARIPDNMRPRSAAAITLAALAAVGILGVALFASPALDATTAAAPELQVGQSYQPLQPLPTPTGGGDTQTFSGFLQTIFQLSIIAAGMLAVMMLTWAGFEYMTSDAFTKKNAAKERMRNAIIGLLIVLGAVLILSTINPNITGLQSFGGTQSSGQQNGDGASGGSTNPPQGASSDTNPSWPSEFTPQTYADFADTAGLQYAESWCRNLNRQPVRTPDGPECHATGAGQTETTADIVSQLSGAGINVAQPENVAGLTQDLVEHLRALKSNCDETVGSCAYQITRGTDLFNDGRTVRGIADEDMIEYVTDLLQENELIQQDSGMTVGETYTLEETSYLGLVTDSTTRFRLYESGRNYGIEISYEE